MPRDPDRGNQRQQERETDIGDVTRDRQSDRQAERQAATLATGATRLTQSEGESGGVFWGVQ